MENDGDIQTEDLILLIRKLNLDLTSWLEFTLRYKGMSGFQVISMVYFLRHHREGTYLTELCHETGVSKSALSGLIKKLRNAGYLSFQEDRRISAGKSCSRRPKLLEEGKEFLRKADEMENAFCGALEPGERRRLWEILKRLADAGEGTIKEDRRLSYSEKVIQQLGIYKKDTYRCIGLTALEVIMEILMPFITAIIIDQGLEAKDLGVVYRFGGMMVVMAFLSLTFGGLAGKDAASAASGLAANLREAIYANIQTFSFSNIDKFSVPSLVTRMTTDITNVQNAFMMVIRVAVRAPLNLIFSFTMCLIISPHLSGMFLIAVVFLVIVIGAIMVVTLKIFREVFRRYDDLNASVQENVTAIRVVKAFVREEHENEKFARASKMLRDLSVKAESLLAFNAPAMMVAVYFCIISVSWLGAKFIVGGSLTTGDLTSLFSYIMSLLMSLMMLSMVIVMISMSMASIRRIGEVLDEKPDLTDPEDPVMEVADGQIDFNHVNFSYKHGSGKNA